MIFAPLSEPPRCSAVRNYDTSVLIPTGDDHPSSEWMSCVWLVARNERFMAQPAITKPHSYLIDLRKIATKFLHFGVWQGTRPGPISIRVRRGNYFFASFQQPLSLFITNGAEKVTEP